jgi:hypothetical protein
MGGGGTLRFALLSNLNSEGFQIMISIASYLKVVHTSVAKVKWKANVLLAIVFFFNGSVSADCGANCEEPGRLDPIIVTGSNYNNNCYTDCGAPYWPPVYDTGGTVVGGPILFRVSEKQAKQAEDRFMKLCRGGSQAQPEPGTEWLTRANTVCLTAARGSSAEVQACRNFFTQIHAGVTVTGQTPVLYNDEGEVRRKVGLCIDQAPLEG